LLTIEKGFCWDGASGALDTEGVLRASAAHDAGCNWRAKGLLTAKEIKAFDDLFYKLLKEDGVCGIRASYMYKAVRVNTKLRYG
jgi:hypothetical protein